MFDDAKLLSLVVHGRDQYRYLDCEFRLSNNRTYLISHYGATPRQLLDNFFRELALRPEVVQRVQDLRLLPTFCRFRGSLAWSLCVAQVDSKIVKIGFYVQDWYENRSWIDVRDAQGYEFCGLAQFLTDWQHQQALGRNINNDRRNDRLADGSIYDLPFQEEDSEQSIKGVV